VKSRCREKKKKKLSFLSPGEKKFSKPKLSLWIRRWKKVTREVPLNPNRKINGTIHEERRKMEKD